MGHIKHVLKEREVGEGFYDLTARLEIEEAIHFHYNDMRLFLDKKRFLKLCKMFSEAKKKFDDMGSPETTDVMHLLSNCELEPSEIGGRIGIEIQEDNRVHIHYNDLRIHLTLGDLFVFFETFEQASHNMPEDRVKLLKFDECDFPEVVWDYIKMLEGYSPRPKNNYNHFKNKIINKQSALGNMATRNFGLPTGFPAKYDPRLNEAYLKLLYGYIKRHGYAIGAHERKYMVAYDLPEKPHILNSHRLAVLMSLGFTSAKCYLVEKESNWKE